MALHELDALDRAVDEFRAHLAAVRTEQWTNPTPCTNWDVRYLVAHVVGGNRFASMVLDRRPAQDALTVVMGTQQLGADPLVDFDESTTRQRAGFRRVGALEALVSHPLGDLSGERFLTMRVFDVAVHAWDLATALGRESTIDDALAEHVLRTVLREVPGMGFGIEPCGEVRPDAPPLERLLDLSGRCIGRAPA